MSAFLGQHQRSEGVFLPGAAWVVLAQR
jgi:hypothetical protein